MPDGSLQELIVYVSGALASPGGAMLLWREHRRAWSMCWDVPLCLCSRHSKAPRRRRRPWTTRGLYVYSAAPPGPLRAGRSGARHRARCRRCIRERPSVGRCRTVQPPLKREPSCTLSSTVRRCTPHRGICYARSCDRILRLILAIVRGPSAHRFPARSSSRPRTHGRAADPRVGLIRSGSRRRLSGAFEVRS